VVRHGGTWALDPDIFSFRVLSLDFLYFRGLILTDRPLPSPRGPYRPVEKIWAMTKTEIVGISGKFREKVG